MNPTNPRGVVQVERHAKLMRLLLQACWSESEWEEFVEFVMASIEDEEIVEYFERETGLKANQIVEFLKKIVE